MTEQGDSQVSEAARPSKLENMGLLLIGVGLGMYCLQYIAFSTLAVQSEWQTGLFVALGLLGVWLPILGLAQVAAAKGRSPYWGAMALLPIIGPLLGLAALGLDSVLSQRAVPLALRGTVKLACALSVPALLLAIIIPTVLRYGARARQEEAITNLGTIFVKQKVFWHTARRYGTLDEIGFSLEGTSNRYTYRIDQSGAPGTVIPASDGSMTPDNRVIHAGISQDGQSFTATATANLDGDPTLDQWHVNDTWQNLSKADMDDGAS